MVGFLTLGALGACTPAPEAPTTCTVDDDCTHLLGEDRCRGRVSCVDGTCLEEPSFAVLCPAILCQVNTCDPATGACVAQPAGEGELCSDADACTTDDRCLAGACTGGPLCTAGPCRLATCDSGVCGTVPTADLGACDDGDACTAGDTCFGGSCRGAPAECPEDGNPCTTERCEANCAPEPLEGTPCDDGDPCTLGDQCAAGACASLAPTCPLPANPCDVALCDPATGACTVVSADDGAACDDGKACTKGDSCQAGVCVSGGPKCKEHPSACIATACDPLDGGCVNGPVAATCDDNDPCTVDDFCKAGTCGGVAVVCEGPACAPAACSFGECVPVPVVPGTPCDDGDACTVADACQAGLCRGAPLCPNDGNPCTLEGCSPTGCVAPPAADGVACDDGDACTLPGACVAGSCVAGPDLACDDGVACTLDLCARDGGCFAVPVADGGACDDGDLCTVGDSCAVGVCAGEPLKCPDDGLACTTESCGAAGCVSTPATGVPCEDGEPCTTGDQCKDGQCAAGGPTLCAAGPCTTAACKPGLGCTAAPMADSSPCDDGDACTMGDACAAGVCVPAAPVACEALGEACRERRCVGGSCVITTRPEGFSCDDSNPCTSADACGGGECLGLPLVCPEAAPCQVAVCDPATAACTTTAIPNGSACEDGDPCTGPGTCTEAQCLPGQPVACPDDGNPCTAETCAGGCASTPLTGAPCTDGDPCTPVDRCASGICAGGGSASCPSDGDPCTADACVKGAGCVYLPGNPGAACDDGSACTTDDRCAQGSCVGSAKTCPAGNPCQVTACQPDVGCVLLPGPVAQCDDGSACTNDDLCAGGACTGTPIDCGDAPGPCTVRVCDPGAGGCVTAPAPVGPCDDGSACTTDDACDGDGACRGSALPCPAGACRVATCNPATGACGEAVGADGAACDDGLPCVLDDVCIGGLCRPGATPLCTAQGPCRVAHCNDGACSETTAADALGCADGNPCTTSDRCAGGLCVGVPTDCDDDDNCTADLCDLTVGCRHLVIPGCSGGNPCATSACPAGPCELATCDPVSGACGVIPAPSGAACDDTDPCTANDQCVDGSCDGESVSCLDPSGDCVVGVCVPGLGCGAAAAADATPCDDDPCAHGGACALGSCTGGQAIECAHGPCTTAVCDPASGCVEAPVSDGTPCDDGDPCTTASTCTTGLCAGPESCVAGPCELAFCHPVTGCTTTPAPTGTACEDGDRCTVGDVCGALGCTSGAPKTCASTTCLPAACEPSTGECSAGLAPDGTACDDADGCTLSSACKSGACLGTSTLTCPPPSDPCLIAACTPSAGCATAPAPTGTLCDDADSCTADDRCATGSCIGVVAVICPAPSGCVGAACDPSSGVCLPDLLSDGAPCDDGDVCHPAASCAAGECVADSDACCGGAGECDDADPCTSDTCNGGVCRHTPTCPSLTVAALSTGGLELLSEGLAVLATWPTTPLATLHGRREAFVGARTDGALVSGDASGIVWVVASTARDAALGPNGIVELRADGSLLARTVMGASAGTPIQGLAPGSRLFEVGLGLEPAGRLAWLSPDGVVRTAVGGPLTGAARDDQSSALYLLVDGEVRRVRATDGGFSADLGVAGAAVAPRVGPGFWLGDLAGSVSRRTSAGALEGSVVSVGAPVAALVRAGAGVVARTTVGLTALVGSGATRAGAYSAHASLDDPP